VPDLYSPDKAYAPGAKHGHSLSPRVSRPPESHTVRTERYSVSPARSTSSYLRLPTPEIPISAPKVRLQSQTPSSVCHPVPRPASPNRCRVDQPLDADTDRRPVRSDRSETGLQPVLVQSVCPVQVFEAADLPAPG